MNQSQPSANTRLGPGTHTVKITLEGHPLVVDAIVISLKGLFQVTYESKDQHIKLTGHIRRYIRLVPPEPYPTGGANL